MNTWYSSQGLFETSHDLFKNGVDFIHATLALVKGSAPQEPGAKILIGANGLCMGTIGGGKFEYFVVEKAKQKLGDMEAVRAELVTVNLQRDLGMSCGGEVQVLFELVRANPKLTLAVFGAGHVAQALVPILLTLDVKVFWFDSRPEWLEKGPKADSKLTKILYGDDSILANEIEKLPRGSYIVSLTKGHQTDLDVLRLALKRNDWQYIGVIGSELKSKSLKDQLSREKVNLANLTAIHCPIGENIGRNEPPEIAISIVAQILRIRGS